MVNIKMNINDGWFDGGLNWVQKFWFSEHGSLSSNPIGQNGYLGGMRLLRDSGSHF